VRVLRNFQQLLLEVELVCLLIGRQLLIECMRLLLPIHSGWVLSPNLTAEVVGLLQRRQVRLQVLPVCIIRGQPILQELNHFL